VKIKNIFFSMSKGASTHRPSTGPATVLDDVQTQSTCIDRLYRRIRQFALSRHRCTRADVRPFIVAARRKKTSSTQYTAAIRLSTFDGKFNWHAYVGESRPAYLLSQCSKMFAFQGRLTPVIFSS